MKNKISKQVVRWARLNIGDYAVSYGDQRVKAPTLEQAIRKLGLEPGPDLAWVNIPEVTGRLELIEVSKMEL